MRIASILIISLLLLSCSTIPQKKNYFRMDTLVEITIFQEKDKNKCEKVFAEIDSFMSIWDDRFSPSSENSEILKINTRTNDTVEISEDLYEMLETALDFSQKLDGAFDITIKPLKDFWNVGKNNGEFLPDPADTAILDTLAAILENVDYRKISLIDNPKRVIFENREVKIDLGGIAKGFAIEKICEILKNSGLNNFIVNAGGDIFVSGKKSRREEIVVGIQNPRDGGILKVLEMNGGALVTSGDYERFRIAESGLRVHHIFDTKTGFPVSKNIAISIMGENIITADILATGLFAMTETEIRKKIKEFPNYEFLLVDSAKNLISSQKFGK